MMAQHSMNTTPKDRVKAVYPQAMAKKGRITFRVYEFPPPTPGRVLGEGMNVFDAWLDAASKLQGADDDRIQVSRAGNDGRHDQAANHRSGDPLPARQPEAE